MSSPVFATFGVRVASMMGMDDRMRRQATIIRLEGERWRRSQAVISHWEKAARRVRRGAARQERYPYLELAGPWRSGNEPDDGSTSSAV